MNFDITLHYYVRASYFAVRADFCIKSSGIDDVNDASKYYIVCSVFMIQFFDARLMQKGNFISLNE